MTALQLWIALCGLGALVMLQSRYSRLRGVANLVGLAGQPAWLYATGSAGQWGMFALCCAYVALYARGVYNFYRDYKEGIV